MPRHVVARIGELDEGGRKLVHIGNREIVLFNVGQEYFAIANRCPHEGGSLYHGDRIGSVGSQGPGNYEYAPARTVVRCPWHAWEFDIRNGRSYCDPRRIRVPRYAAGAASGSEVVEGPYVAESYEVSQDDAYVYVEL